MRVEEFLREAGVMKTIKHPNLVQLLGKKQLQFLWVRIKPFSHYSIH